MLCAGGGPGGFWTCGRPPGPSLGRTSPGTRSVVDRGGAVERIRVQINQIHPLPEKNKACFGFHSPKNIGSESDLIQLSLNFISLRYWIKYWQKLYFWGILGLDSEQNLIRPFQTGCRSCQNTLFRSRNPGTNSVPWFWFDTVDKYGFGSYTWKLMRYQLFVLLYKLIFLFSLFVVLGFTFFPCLDLTYFQSNHIQI